MRLFHNSTAMKVFYPVFFCATTFVFFIVQGFADDAPKRPNIVWLVADDMSADLGCYGTPGAISPNIDRLAKEGCRFTLAFTHCPVCAPTRSGLITGVYPTTSGALHMRSTLLKPPPMFTDFLKAAGYHVAWPGKTDFNFEVPKQAFSSTTDWLKNPPPEPFFAYLNIPIPHESQIRASKAEHEKHVARLKPSERHDPAKVLLPPYYPDAPEVRNDVAQYQDLVTAVDYRVGDVLKFLDEHQLADNTLVFFFADHGWGMPRGKRWLYDSGIHSPLIVRWPGHVQPGTTRDDLIAFLDFPATVLAAAGVDKPDNMQGRSFSART